MQKLVANLAVLYVLSLGFDSVIRWVLNMAGVAALIYLRDCDLILLLILCSYLLVRSGEEVTRVFFMLCLIISGACVAFYSGLGGAQVLFGLKIWLPFVAGFMLAATGALTQLDRPKAWMSLWLVLCVGIFFNYFYRYPWTGLLIQIGDAPITANREWGMGGIRRLSGFSRASYDAAMIILLLYVYLVNRFAGLFARIGLIAITAIALLLTTTKGAIGAFIGTLILLPILQAVRSPSSQLKRILLGALFALAMIGMITPLISVQIPFPKLTQGSIEFLLFSSFIDRAWNIWPRALALLSDWQFFTGRGIGGIGAAQAVFEPQFYSPGDNFFVYLYVTAGLFGGLFYLFCAYAGSRLSLNEPLHRTAFLLLFSIMADGLTVNVVESSVCAVALGALTCFLTTARERAHVPSSKQAFAPANIPSHSMHKWKQGAFQ